MRLIRMQALIAVGGLGILLLAQNPVPDSSLYVAVFRQIEGTKNFADHLASEKKDDKPMRDSTRKDTGLTPTEYAAVQAIALDCLAQLQAYHQSRGLLQKQQPMPTTEIAALDHANAQQIGDHIAQLRKTLSPSQFALFDQWARKTVLPTVHHREVKVQ